MHTENNTKPTHSFDGEKFTILATGKVIESVVVRRRSGHVHFECADGSRILASALTPADFVKRFWGGTLAPEAAPDGPSAQMAEAMKGAAAVAASGLASGLNLGIARAAMADDIENARLALAHTIGSGGAKHAECPALSGRTIERLSRFEPSGSEPWYHIVYSIGRGRSGRRGRAGEVRATINVLARHLAREVTDIMVRGGVIYSVEKFAR